MHVALPRRLAAACQRQGVRRLVHVSALGVGPQGPSNYLRSKAAGEQVLREADLDLSILRPSVIFGAQDRFLNLFAALQDVAPVLPLAGADARFQPVWVNDVAAAVVACLARPDTIGQTYECAGPDVFTLADLVRLAGTLSGHPRPIVPLPAALARLQAGGHGMAARRAADVARQPRIHARAQRGNEYASRPVRAGHHGHRAGGGGAGLPGARPGVRAPERAARPASMKPYIVGGAVRDALLGLPVNDRDWVLVGATPEALVAAGYQPVGKDLPGLSATPPPTRNTHWRAPSARQRRATTALSSMPSRM